MGMSKTQINVTSTLKKREGNWAELTFEKTSGTVTWELFDS